MLTFFVLDYLYYPAFMNIDIKISIGDENIRNIMDLKSDYFPIIDLFDFSIWDIFSYVIQSAIAFYFGKFANNKFTVRP